MIQNNTTYYLITTGLDINPKNGPYSEFLYNVIKNTAQSKATINYEAEIREFSQTQTNGFLLTYNSTPRKAFQYLFGVETHSNTWTVAELSNKLSLTTFVHEHNYGEYCVDFPISIDNGFAVYKNIGGSWTKQNLYYTYGNMSYYYGNDDDIAMNINNNTMQFLTKNNGTWKTLHSLDNVLVQTSTPAIQSGYWIKNLGIIINKYNGYYLHSSTVAFSNASPSEALVYINATGPNWTFEEYSSGSWNSITLSKYLVQDKATNSWFDNASNNNNFIIDENEDALSGGPLHISFTNNQIYDIGITYDGKPEAGQTLVRYPFPSNVIFPVDFQGSKAVAGTASSGSAVFSIRKNNIEIGTVTFSASSVGVFTSSSNSVTFNKNDILTIICPNPQNSTLDSIGFSIQGLRY